MKLLTSDLIQGRSGWSRHGPSLVCSFRDCLTRKRIPGTLAIILDDLVIRAPEALTTSGARDETPSDIPGKQGIPPAAYGSQLVWIDCPVCDDTRVECHGWFLTTRKAGMPHAGINALLGGAVLLLHIARAIAVTSSRQRADKDRTW